MGRLQTGHTGFSAFEEFEVIGRIGFMAAATGLDDDLPGGAFADQCLGQHGIAMEMLAVPVEYGMGQPEVVRSLLGLGGSRMCETSGIGSAHNGAGQGSFALNGRQRLSRYSPA